LNGHSPKHREENQNDKTIYTINDFSARYASGGGAGTLFSHDQSRV
jgi:hypothetical protein